MLSASTDAPDPHLCSIANHTLSPSSNFHLHGGQYPTRSTLSTPANAGNSRATWSSTEIAFSSSFVEDLISRSARANRACLSSADECRSTRRCYKCNVRNRADSIPTNSRSSLALPTPLSFESRLRLITLATSHLTSLPLGLRLLPQTLSQPSPNHFALGHVHGKGQRQRRAVDPAAGTGPITLVCLLKDNTGKRPVHPPAAVFIPCAPHSSYP